MPVVALQIAAGAIGCALIAQHDLRLVVVGALIAFRLGRRGARAAGCRGLLLVARRMFLADLVTRPLG
jgi:hypothetical protein